MDPTEALDQLARLKKLKERTAKMAEDIPEPLEGKT